MGRMERKHEDPAPPHLSAENIGGNRNEPASEIAFTPPLIQRFICGQESRLSHFLRLVSMAAESKGQVQERSLPAKDDTLEGIHIA